VERTDDGDLLVDDVIPIAHRAESNVTFLDLVEQVRKRRLVVDRSCCEQEDGSGNRMPVDSRAKDLPLLDGGDAAADHLHAEPLCLLSHAPQQVRSSDSCREARIIARSRDERGTAVARIDKHNPAPKAGQVDRSGEASRASANDQTVGNACGRTVHRRC